VKKTVEPPNNNGLRYHIGPTHATPGEITDSEYFQGAMSEASFAVAEAECYLHEDVDRLVKSKQLRAALRTAVSARIKTAVDLVILALKECPPMVNTFNAHREARKRHGTAGKLTPHATPMEAIIERVCRQAWTDNQTLPATLRPKRTKPWKANRLADSLVRAVQIERAKAKPALKKVKLNSIKRMITRYFDEHQNMPKT
jgi:hypothetical protein